MPIIYKENSNYLKNVYINKKYRTEKRESKIAYAYMKADDTQIQKKSTMVYCEKCKCNMPKIFIHCDNCNRCTLNIQSHCRGKKCNISAVEDTCIRPYNEAHPTCTYRGVFVQPKKQTKTLQEADINCN